MYINYPELKSKIAIITGASGNVGRGISYILGKQGMKLILVGLAEIEGLAFEKELILKGIDTRWITADLTQISDVENVIEQIDQPYLLVNNAAILNSKPILEFDVKEFNNSLVNNLKILHHLTYHILKKMIQYNNGVVINISSVGGQRAHYGLCGYDTYKGAMDSFTRSTSIDIAPHGIRVNGIAPGAIGVRKGTDKHCGIPLGRLGKYDEIGMVAAFLASDSAAYITGQTLNVDGGLTAQLTPPGIFI